MAKNPEDDLNTLLKEEHKQDWTTIAVPSKIIALLCFSFPAMSLISSQDYNHQNVVAVLFFSLVIGAGFYGYYRNFASLKTFYSKSRPSDKTLRAIQEQEAADQGHLNSNVPAQPPIEEELLDWDSMVALLEQSMNEDSDSMNLSTMFDRAELEQATLSQPNQKRNWFKRFFRKE